MKLNRQILKRFIEKKHSSLFWTFQTGNEKKRKHKRQAGSQINLKLIKKLHLTTG